MAMVTSMLLLSDSAFKMAASTGEGLEINTMAISRWQRISQQREIVDHVVRRKK